MPLDTLMNIRDEAWGRPWKRQFAWWPHRCYYSKKLIWLTWAYSGSSTYITNTPILWMTKQQHLMNYLSKE